MSGEKSKDKRTEKIEAERASYHILNLINRVENLRMSDVSKCNGDIVAFVGLTKSGKSTLINCLMGAPLICRKDPETEDTFIVHGTGGNGPKIGVGGESETEEPTQYDNLPGTDMALWDFPGFGDNKGTDQEILNAICYQKILRAQNSVRFVVVASYTLIKGDNPLPFFELLHNLLHICPKIAESLCIVGSKGEKGSLRAILLKAAAQKFPNAEDGRKDVIHKSQQLISSVLQNGNYIDFRAPKMEGDVLEAKFELPNKQQIIDCITKLKGAKMGDVPLVISHEAKLDISGYYEACYNILSSKIDELCGLLRKFMDSNGINVKEGTAAVKLVIYQKAKVAVESLLGFAKSFEDFFDAANDAGIAVGSELPDHIERFRFIEELQFLYKITDKLPRGIEEFLNTVLLCLKDGITQLSSLIAHSEACTAEEKRKEEEAARKHEREMKALKEEAEKLAKANQEAMAAAAKARPIGFFSLIGAGLDLGVETIFHPQTVAEKIAGGIVRGENGIFPTTNRSTEGTSWNPTPSCMPTGPINPVEVVVKECALM